jgi:hypothetical protein
LFELYLLDRLTRTNLLEFRVLELRLSFKFDSVPVSLCGEYRSISLRPVFSAVLSIGSVILRQASQVPQNL